MDYILDTSCFESLTPETNPISLQNIGGDSGVYCWPMIRGFWPWNVNVLFTWASLEFVSLTSGVSIAGVLLGLAVLIGATRLKHVYSHN